jgi:hypothetical protein
MSGQICGRSHMHGTSSTSSIDQSIYMASAFRARLSHSGVTSLRARPHNQGFRRQRNLLGNLISASALLELPESVTATIGSAERVKSCRLITAIKTPYLENGKIDLKAYDTLVCHQIRNGVEVRQRAKRGNLVVLRWPVRNLTDRLSCRW